MTFTELKKEVAALGFENRAYQDALLAIFANRALRTVFSDRAVTRTLKIFIPPIKPLNKRECLHHKGGTEETVSLRGRAYSIEVSGSGTLIIDDGGEHRRCDFDHESLCIKGFIRSGSATLTLFGECSFFIPRLVTFAEAYTDDPERIPDADGRSVNRQAVENGDFLCFTSAPTDKSGAIADCVCMEDGTLTFAPDVSGEFYVNYRRSPSPIVPEAPLEPIDVPSESEHLLTLLTASYMCLEYDPEQAKLYRSVYENEMRELNRSTSARISAAYRDVTGWG